MDTTNWGLVQAANTRWAEIAEQIGAEHYERNQLFDLIQQVTHANGIADDACEEAESEEAKRPHWYAEAVTYAFRCSLQAAFYAAQTPEDDPLRLLAAIGLNADRCGIASCPQEDGSLLVVQVRDSILSMTGDLVRSLGGELVHYVQELHAEGFSMDLPVAMWRVPAESAGQWESWLERVYGPRDDADRRPADERYAVWDEVRAKADSRV